MSYGHRGGQRGSDLMQLEDSVGGSPRRSSVDKGKAAKGFRKETGKTKALNMAQAPMRGGWRL